VRRLWRLLHCWWSADRIRISPSAGRLLRLGPGSVLVLAGEPVRVVGRSAEAGGVAYHCIGVAGDCDVLVSPSAGIVVRRHGAPDQVLDTAGQVDVYSMIERNERTNNERTNK
jgi:hypothetical protein